MAILAMTAVVMVLRLLSALLLPLLIHLILLLMLILLLCETLPGPPCNDEPRLLLPDQHYRSICFLANILVLLGPLAVHFPIEIRCQ